MFDNIPVLRKLYGPVFDTVRIRQGQGRGSMLVLGHHNSGTSMLARLLMLMGAFQGNLDGARAHKLARLPAAPARPLAARWPRWRQPALARLDGRPPCAAQASARARRIGSSTGRS